MKLSFLTVRRALVSASALLLGMTLFVACKKDSGTGEQPPIAALMAFNLSPDQSTVGITLSGNNLVNSPLNFTNFTGGYLNIYPGDRTIISYDSFKDSSLASSSYNFEPNKYYSLFVVGNNGTYKNLVAWDNLDSLSSKSGKAYVRYVNAVPDSNALNVSITANGNNVSNSPAAFATISEFIPVSAGEVKIDLTGGDTVAANRTITLEGGKAYTVLLVGLPSATDTTKKVQIKFIKNGG